MLFDLDYMKKIYAVLLFKFKVTTLLGYKKAILYGISAPAWSSCKAIWTLFIVQDQVPLKDKWNLKP